MVGKLPGLFWYPKGKMSIYELLTRTRVINTSKKDIAKDIGLKSVG